MRNKGSAPEKESSTDDRIEILSSVNIFRESNSAFLNELAQSLEEFVIEKNEVVFHKGDLLQSMYIIIDGSVKVHDGEYEFARFSKNEFFGEYSLIDSSVRSASVTALEKTRLLKLTKSVFDEILNKNSEIAKAILRALIKRLRSNNVLEEELTQRSLELKKEKEEIEQKRKELEELNATKDKFFSIIAHDLKNPFNTVIGLSELLLYRYDSYDDDKIKEFIEQINTFSSNAYNLLDNLLQWARSQTGRIKVQPSNVDISSLIRENLMLLQDEAEKKNIFLHSSVREDAFCYADSNMIHTVIRNLISNAIKFTPEGGEINIECAEYDKDMMQISVDDNGVGISEEDMPKLFNLATNYSSEGTNAEKGTGLGLILCKEFVEKNNGKIWVESEEGNGSSFIFTLPKSKKQ